MDTENDELVRLRARVLELEREAKTATLATEELNRRIIEAMPGGIVHVGSDGAILNANAEALRILGFSYDELTQRYTRDFDAETIWEDGTACPAADYPVTRALVSGEAQPRATIGVRRPDGTVSWAVFTAVPVKDPTTQATTGVVVTFLDITAQKRIEAAFRERESRLRSVLESAPNPIAYTDAEGNLLYVNQTGPSRTLAEIVGKPAWSHFAPGDQATTKRNFAEVMATKETRRYEGVAYGRRYLLHMGPVLDGDACVGATIVAWDVTDQRALEANAMISDRMAAIGTLTAGIAHEINNPLTYLLANIEWLERELRGDPSAAAKLAAAKEGATRIRAIVGDLSTFSHVGETRRVLVDVHDLLDSALRMAENTIRPRARVVKTYGDVAPVYASDARLAQVFLNLIVNAAQAIGDGDPARHRIEVTTTMTREKDRDRVVVEVRDTGSGIAPELLPRLFDPFVTTKSVGSGTGLGLYICRSVVDAIGGTITAENAPDGGALFRVTLPASGTRPPSEAPPPPPRDAMPKVLRLRVLVVDDEPSILAIVATFLAEHSVTVAHGGREALALVDATDYDVILCDLMMPEVSGIEVYEHLAAKGKGDEKRMAFITGGAVTARARAFLDQIPNVVLAKPFGPEELMAVVAETRR